jgi:transcriptional regulator with PAS, ATPase and Fis domain
MIKVIAKARRIAPHSVPVLIEGESGTGKELLAHAIHRASPRAKRHFVPVNCGAIPSELVESELFGHERGAFTGAVKQRIGHFEEAHEGTLFLDEIGELPLPAQVKLLRVLQEKEIVRVGSSRTIPMNVRIIAATNRSLIQQVKDGRFRGDLLYRLAVIVLKLPALRERPGDVSLLIDYLLSKINREGKAELGFKDKIFSAAAKNLLLNQAWPGNVRELHNTILRAAIWSDGNTIQEEDVAEALLTPLDGNEPGVLNRPLGDGLNLQNIMALVARHYLERAMLETHGNKTRAAALLSLPNYQTLSNWLKKFDIKS